MVELTVKDLVETWKYGIERWGGGGTGEMFSESESKLDRVLYTARYYATQDDEEGNVLAYAGSLLFYLGDAQHMPDGNKRLAWGACTKAFEVNGFMLDIKDRPAEQFVFRIADSQREDHLGKAEDVIEALAEFVTEANWASRSDR